jgi:hypothetical protein
MAGYSDACGTQEAKAGGVQGQSGLYIKKKITKQNNPNDPYAKCLPIGEYINKKL